MLLVIIALTLIVAYLLQINIKFLIRNYRAQKFFKTKTPNLPVVPNPNIFAGHSLKIMKPAKNWKIVEDLHEIHGPTFGYYFFEQPWVSTKDINLIKLIFVDEANKHLDRPFLGVPFSEYNNSINQVNGKRWKQVRRIIAPALTNMRVKSDDVVLDIETIVSELAASLERRAAKSLEETQGKSPSFIIEGRNLFERFTLAVVMLTTYKQSKVINFDSDRDAWVHDMDRAANNVVNPLVIVCLAAPELMPICEWLNKFSAFGKVTSKIVKFIELAVDSNEADKLNTINESSANDSERSLLKTKQSSQSKRYLVDTIIDALHSSKINYDDFVGSLYFLLLAGFITTADTITCLIWHLARNQDIQDKLRQTILESGIEADYVVWCINETIRYHPAVPFFGGRVLGDDVTIDGLFLPKGTHVMPTTHGIHHDPNIWPEPERFNPERWRDQASFHPAAFMGFGLGPRNCVGGKLAVHEIKLVLRMLLTNYKIDQCDQTPEEWRFSSPGLMFTLNDDPIMIEFTPIAGTCAQAAARNS